MPRQPQRQPGQHDERVSLHPLDPREALKALLKVDPATVPAEPENGNGKREKRPAKPRKK
jgi:hypothetical protein